MALNRELRRLLAGFMLAFTVIAMSATYWAVVERDRLLSRDDNPRLLEARAAIQRGAIYDRTGELLAVSERGLGRQRVRRYLHPETFGALGYYSLRYGAGNVEAIFEPILSGSDQPRVLEDYILQRPQVGTDIQLTLDLSVQRAIDESMRGKTGAVVVLAVPSGHILGLLSAPTYNPNTLDQDWDMLRAMPGNPFFNRPLQGRYQPGAAFQTPILSRLLLGSVTANTSFENAASPVILDDLILACAAPAPMPTLTLRDAYAFACPAPLADLASTLPEGVFGEMLTLFASLNQYDLRPSVANSSVDAQPSLTPTSALRLTTHDRLEIALGQGQLTVSPISMALLTAAILDNGNTPQPKLLLATRPPGTAWVTHQSTAPSLPLMTQSSAQQLQELMRYAVTDGAAASANRPPANIAGHAAVAFTGESALAWFIGFNDLNTGEGVVVAVVIENSADPVAAANIGGSALQAAARALEAASTSFP